MSDPTKDKSMAANLKKLGVTRKTGRCPACHRVVQLKSLPGHIRILCGYGGEKVSTKK